MVQKDEVSKFFCPKSAHSRSFWSEFYGIAGRACLHNVLIEVTKNFRKIQVGRSLLELCSRHVICVRSWSLKLRSSDNLLMMLRLASPTAFLSKIEVSSARSRESLETFCSSIAVGSCHTGSPLFLTGAVGPGGNKGRRSSSSFFR